MRSHDSLTDEQLDALLDGAPGVDLAGSPVAAYLASVRDAAAATPTSPSEQLGVVLADGLAPADAAAQGILTFSTTPAQQGILTASTDRGILTRGILTMRLRSRVFARVLVTKFAALGLLSKAAVAGATVTVAASSAGAAGVLPPPAQIAFDQAVGRQVAEAPEDVDVDGASTDVATEDEPGIEGRGVADDATGADGSERGVVGRDIADEASDGRAGGPDDVPGRSGDVPGPDGELPGQADDQAPGATDRPSEAPERPSEQAEPSPPTARGPAGD